MAVEDSREPTDAEVRRIGERASSQGADPSTVGYTEREETPGRGLRRRSILTALVVLLASLILAAGVVVGRRLGLFDGSSAPSMADAPHKQEPAPSESHGNPKPPSESHEHPEASGSDPFVAGGGSGASSQLLPEEKGAPLPPAEYKTTEFEPAMTFRVAEEGWELRHHESSDVIGLKNGEMWLAFLNVTKVYPESKLETASPIPAPDNLTAWIQSHDYLLAKEQHRVVIGGQSGVEFDHVDIAVPHQVVGVCKLLPGNTPCLPLFYMHAADESGHAVGGSENAAMHTQGMVYSLLEGETGKVIVLPNVEGESVVILMQGTHDALEQSSSEAENLLDTVQWNG